MAKADLTAQRLRELLHYDQQTGVFTRLVSPCNSAKVGDVAGFLGDKGYIIVRVDCMRYKAHRIAVLYMTGEWPIDEVDHINGVKNDNRWSNLRCATHKQNLENQRPGKANSSQIVGVRWYQQKERWTAQITHNGRQIHLGSFREKEDALKARRAAETLLFTHTALSAAPA